MSLLPEGVVTIPLILLFSQQDMWKIKLNPIKIGIQSATILLFFPLRHMIWRILNWPQLCIFPLPPQIWSTFAHGVQYSVLFTPLFQSCFHDNLVLCQLCKLLSIKFTIGYYEPSTRGSYEYHLNFAVHPTGHVKN